MNRWQWSRRIFITICAITSGTIFLYIKQNIHDIKAFNYEGHYEEFDHPFALLFFVYIGQMLIFSCACLLNGPIRNQVLEDFCRTRCAAAKFLYCLCRSRNHLEYDCTETGEAERFLPVVPLGQPVRHVRNIDPDDLGVIITPNHQHQVPVDMFPGLELEDQEGFIKLFVDGDETLRLVNYLPPAILMLLSTSFVYYAFGATYPATIVMFRAVSLGAAGFLRCRFMCNALRVKQSFSIRQWLAVMIMMSAVAHSAYYDFTASKGSEQRNDISYLVTVPLLSLAHVGFAVADTSDEKFFHERRGIPLIMCFVEATLGTIIYALILPILYLIPDPLYPTTQGGIMENALNAFVQLKNNPKIISFVIGLGISETIWMAARAFITRHANAFVKTIIDSLQLVFIRYVTPELYVCSKQSEQTTVFTVVVFGLGVAVFYFSERNG